MNVLAVDVSDISTQGQGRISLRKWFDSSAIPGKSLRFSDRGLFFINKKFEFFMIFEILNENPTKILFLNLSSFSYQKPGIPFISCFLPFLKFQTGI